MPTLPQPGFTIEEKQDMKIPQHVKLSINGLNPTKVRNAKLALFFTSFYIVSSCLK